MAQVAPREQVGLNNIVRTGFQLFDNALQDKLEGTKEQVMKKFLGIGALFAGAALAFTALAQANYPVRPITMVVPWSPGGSTDLTSRAMAPILDKILGTPINVVNRTGGGGAVGHGSISTSRPDGYTIGIITLEVVLPPWVEQTKIDAKAFSPISLLVLNPVAITVRKDAPWKTIQELIADIKANPGKFKSAGTAKFGSYDFARLGFLDKIGLEDKTLPWVPTQGAAAALQELVAGGVNVAFTSIGESSALTKAGEIRQLAFMTDKRFEGFPEVPTLKELGINWTFASFLMAAAPKNTLTNVVAKLDESFGKAAQDPEFIKFMKNANLVINYLDTKKSKAFLAERSKAMAALYAAVK
jgi:tripartite-type tricarboxylate transporter receptor subunit TctC